MKKLEDIGPDTMVTMEEFRDLVAQADPVGEMWIEKEKEMAATDAYHQERIKRCEVAIERLRVGLEKISALEVEDHDYPLALGRAREIARETLDGDLEEPLSPEALTSAANPELKK